MHHAVSQSPCISSSENTFHIEWYSLSLEAARDGNDSTGNNKKADKDIFKTLKISKDIFADGLERPLFNVC